MKNIKNYPFFFVEDFQISKNSKFFGIKKFRNIDHMGKFIVMNIVISLPTKDIGNA